MLPQEIFPISLLYLLLKSAISTQRSNHLQTNNYEIRDHVKGNSLSSDFMNSTHIFELCRFSHAKLQLLFESSNKHPVKDIKPFLDLQLTT